MNIIIQISCIQHFNEIILYSKEHIEERPMTKPNLYLLVVNYGQWELEFTKGNDS
jgi:hypothetical protein